MSLTIFRSATALSLVAFVVAGCDHPTDEEKNADLGPLNAVEATGISDIMLNLADPNESVEFFRESLSRDPDNPDLKRNYALALVRAKKHADAALVFEDLISTGAATDADRLAYADSLVRNGAWDEARTQLNAVPPTVENFDRYFLEALVADHFKEWEKADSYYDVARGLTTRPAQVLNNWGVSKRERGALADAEKLFRQAIVADPSMFAAKNNLVITRARRKVYDLPVMSMTDVEKAVLLFNIAQQAIENGDRDVAAGLLDTAIDTHPQYFEAAVNLRDSL